MGKTALPKSPIVSRKLPNKWLVHKPYLKMKSVFKLAAGLSLALGLAAGSARATIFDFSYTFADDSLVVTGTLAGDLNGNFVDNVSNVSVFFNGTAVPGPVNGFTNDGSGWVPGPIVSFDASENNFSFGTTDPADLDFSSDATFLFSMSPVDGYVLGYYPPVGASLDVLPVADGSWKLTAETTGTVPDGGATVLLLGAGLGLLGWIRRKSHLLSARSVTG